MRGDADDVMFGGLVVLLAAAILLAFVHQIYTNITNPCVEHRETGAMICTNVGDEFYSTSRCRPEVQCIRRQND